MIEFFCPCNPPTKTAQAKRLGVVRGKAMMFSDGKSRAIERMYESMFLPHQPKVPLAAPLSLTIVVTYPYTKADLSTAAKRKFAEEQGVIPHTSKPDCDNLAKQLTDILEDLRFMEHDAHIADLRVIKFRGSRPGIYVRLEDLSCLSWSTYKSHVSFQPREAAEAFLLQTQSPWVREASEALSLQNVL